MKRLATICKSASAAVMLLVAACMAGGTIIAPVSAVSGSDWQPGRIIDDAIFYNKSSMTTNQIQQFLNAKVPTCDSQGTQPYGGTTRAAYSQAHGVTLPLICLKDYQENPTTHANNLNGNPVPSGAESAASIIWDASQDYNINPEVLIVLLQKEQGLVTDDWPWPYQYQSATGYGCPDSSGCDSQYYGFYNQVMNAARQFRLYANNPNSYNYVPFQNNFILYNPNTACGGSNVYIQNEATASLYNYTPYQPNQAALNDLYGSGDSCSSHGNRNFWTYFNDWFGMSLGDGFALVKSDDPNDLRQWVIYGTIKQYVPDSQTIYAWGLQNVPLGTMSGATLGSISTGPNLDRLMRINGGSVLYFVDAGHRYRVPTNLFDAWNFGGVTISSVSAGLGNLPSDAGYLSDEVKDPASSDIYMMDGGGGGPTIIRKFASEDVRLAWDGNNASYNTISTDYWNVIKNAIGTALTGTKISYGGSEFQSIQGYRFDQPASVAPLYPGAAQPVSLATYNRLAPAGPMSHMIRSASGPTVYMMDAGTKHQVLWPDLLSAWTTPSTRIIIVNDAYLNLLTAGSAVNTYFASVSGQMYIVDGGQKTTVPSALNTAYSNVTTPFTASSTLMGLFPTNSAQATGFIKGRNSPAIYLLDNSGKLRHLEWADKVSSWGGYNNGITTVSDSIMSSFSTTTSPQIFVTDGTTNYVLDNGQKYSVSSTVKSQWGLGTPQTFTDGTLSRLPNGGTLGSDFRAGNGYFIVRGGASYGTADVLIADAWGLMDPSKPTYTPAILGLLPNYMLTRYVASNQSGDSRTFLVDNGQWYNLPAAAQANLGVAGQPKMALDPANAPNTITDWTSSIVKNNQNLYFVIDSGGRWVFTNQSIQDHWTNFEQLNVPVVTNGFINSFVVRGSLERAVKGSGPSVYSAEDGTKRHILYPDTYNRLYAPYVQVGDALLNTLPDGSPIN